MSGSRHSAGILRLLDRKLTVQEREITEPTRKRLYVAALVLAMVGAGFFLLLLTGVQQKTFVAGVDGPVNSWFDNQRSPAMTVTMAVLATVFGPVAMPIIVVASTVVWMFRARHAWRPLLLAGAMLTGVILAQVISRLVDRPRPPVEQMLLGGDTTYSFPSGHVLGASDFLLVGAFLVLSRGRYGPGAVVAGFSVAVAGILTQAVSRLYLGYHWLTDTLASISLSLVVLGAVIALDTWRTTRVARAPATKPSTEDP